MQVLYTETVSNPTLVVADLPTLADIAHSHVGSSPCALIAFSDLAVSSVALSLRHVVLACRAQRSLLTTRSAP